MHGPDLQILRRVKTGDVLTDANEMVCSGSSRPRAVCVPHLWGPCPRYLGRVPDVETKKDRQMTAHERIALAKDIAATAKNLPRPGAHAPSGTDIPSVPQE